MQVTTILLMLLAFGFQNETSLIAISINSETQIQNDPVFFDLTPGTLNVHTPVCLSKADGGELTPGQIETLDDDTQRVWWIADMPGNSSASYEIHSGQNCNKDAGFYWTKVRDDATRLMHGDKPVIQYEHPSFDMDNNDATNKPYHHVFDPAGSGLITKGVGGLHSHHRGIFSGYYLYTGDDRKEKAANRGDRLNIWAPSDGERSEHHRIIKEFAGPVMGGHVLEILWRGQNGETLAKERREIRVFKQPRGETMIDYSSSLRPTEGPLYLTGDSHHGGVHFRAAQYVADNSESTRFIRPEHWSHLPPENENKGRTNPENLHVEPWDAMVFHLDDRMYTTAQFTHPDNPGKHEMGERKYGRIGYFFPHDLTENNPLIVKYRFWITAGPAPVNADIDRKYKAYTSSPDMKTAFK